MFRRQQSLNLGYVTGRFPGMPGFDGQNPPRPVSLWQLLQVALDDPGIMSFVCKCAVCTRKHAPPPPISTLEYFN